MAVDSASSSSKPSIMIIPGGASPKAFYETIASKLRSTGGYEVHVFDLLSASRKPPQKPAGMYEDAAFMNEQIKLLCDAGHEVVVICHSYGGLVATEASKGLSKSERKAQGLQGSGGIVRIIYLSTIVGDVGETSMEITKDIPKYDFMVPADEGGHFLKQVPELSADTVWSDIPREQGIEWAKKQSWQATQAFVEPLTHSPFGYFPVSFLVCEQDKVLPPDFQRERVKFLQEKSKYNVDVFEMDVGHCPNVTAPDLTSNVLLAAIVGKV